VTSPRHPPTFSSRIALSVLSVLSVQFMRIVEPHRHENSTAKPRAKAPPSMSPGMDKKQAITYLASIDPSPKTSETEMIPPPGARRSVTSISSSS